MQGIVSSLWILREVELHAEKYLTLIFTLLFIFLDRVKLKIEIKFHIKTTNFRILAYFFPLINRIKDSASIAVQRKFIPVLSLYISLKLILIAIEISSPNLCTTIFKYGQS